jgi:hypothetical protein
MNVGVKTIIDEYALPSKLKTISLVADLLGLDNPISDHQDIYAYDGMMFTIIDTPTYQDEENSILNFSSKYSTVTDDLRRKIATHDMRGKEMVDNAVLIMCSNYLKMAMLKKQNALGARRLFVDNDPSNFVKLSTLLSTIVDCAGFRISVVCPIDVDESRTLIYGKFAQNEKYVNASPEVLNPLIEQLSKLMKISICNVASPLYREGVDILSKDFQIHISSTDNRLYAMGMDSLTTPDMLRPYTHDISTRRMRRNLFKRYLIKLHHQV